MAIVCTIRECIYYNPLCDGNCSFDGKVEIELLYENGEYFGVCVAMTLEE
ncbi:hypothetical protein [Desulfofundulus thermosubterraneus]|uniref:Uncharacterized protein n=1 Tax=Desulfofundulus thermosubterraneus DSM 16057 TaxID=1121432 RepID=A0A1M6KKZ4_9FIRM|nr:hypothetical protein [Desulfofundulus thermosubterraneus]SHJ59596.1 hypothetical protein SAMN02745219_02906 [Desulfofundulus thermosubterraneus DSM 16057]